MELASMLAGEPFSDHPRSVSCVVAAFVRTYNDLIDDRRRDDLYRYAAAAVGSRGSRAEEGARAERCLDWLRTQLGEAGRFECWMLGLGPVTRRKRDLIAERAARYASSSRKRHAATLALIDELLGVTDPALIERELEDLRGVERTPAGELADLRPAGEAVGDDDRALAGVAHRR
jgi:hypothetical protein